MQRQIKSALIVILATLMLLTSVAGCGNGNTNKNVPVTTAIATNGDMEDRLELSGVLVPARTVEIASRITGQVTALGHSVGDSVKTGDVLINLDTQALNGQLMQAQANWEQARAAAEATQKQADISKINFDAAQTYYDRTKALFDGGAVSQSQLDDARDKLDIAARQYENASGPAQAQAEAAIDAAYANVKNLSVQLDCTTITSPIDGIIATQNVNAGQVISAAVSVISIVDTSVLKLKSAVPQDKLALLSVGKELDVSIDAYPGVICKGTITSIGPIALSTGELFPVEISLNNDQGLMPGMSAHSTLVTKTTGIVIPLSSIQQTAEESYVFVIEDQVAHKQVVKPGLRNDEEAEILSGLSEGERVAVSNISLLTDGMTVQAQ